VPPLPHVVVPGRRDDLAALERPEDPAATDGRFEPGPPIRRRRLAGRGAERALAQVGQPFDVILERELADLGPGQLSFSMISSETE
jgi:hypothetical protein